MIKITSDPKIYSLGQSQTPVIVIDEFAESLSALRQIAQNHTHFSPAAGGYPGLRAPLPSAYSRQLIQVVTPLIKSVYALPEQAEGRCCHALFSLVTHAPQALTLLQRLPHFDTVLPHYFAIMHYLGEGDFGGTGFFCHRATAIERVTEENKRILIDSLRREIEKSAPPARYVTGPDERFAMLDSVGYRANRLLIYPGNLLHSGLIHADRDICPDAVKGRLTANIFINFS